MSSVHQRLISFTGLVRRVIGALICLSVLKVSTTSIELLRGERLVRNAVRVATGYTGGRVERISSLV